MSKPSSLTIKPFGAACAVLAAPLLLTLILNYAGLFSRADLSLYDAALRYRLDHNPRPHNPVIFKLDLNDSSEAELGARLDTREAFADAFAVLGECLTGAAVDIVFRRSLPADRELVLAGRKLNPLVYAVIPVPENSGSFPADMAEENRKALRKRLWRVKGMEQAKFPRANSWDMSSPEISASAPLLGHIGVRQDDDGLFRRIPLFYRWEDGLVPSLALAAAAAKLGVKPGTVEWRDGEGLVLPLEGRKPVIIPCDEQGMLLIPYTIRWRDDSYRVSFSRIADIENDPELRGDLLSELYGSLVIVADTTSAKSDFGVTPFETSYPLSEIHATVISAILDSAVGKRVFYAPPPPALKVLVMAAAICFSLFLFLLKSDSLYHLGFAASLCVLAVTGFALWNRAGVIPWLGSPSFLMFSAWGAGFVRRLFARYREQMLYKNALSRYFPRSLAQRIAAEGKIDLAPERKILTMLFADIVGFTRWSSGREAAVVHLFLTDYLESMAGVLFEHGGTVDKFMGDGLLAFFGDPLEQPDHARRGINAAVAMQKKAALLAEKWRDKTGIDLKIRIGINSGPVIVGNLGTRTRIEYTVIGAAVNLAQRMESAAPSGGILVARPAWELAKDDFAFSEKRLLTVKGYDEPVESWEVVF